MLIIFTGLNGFSTLAIVSMSYELAIELSFGKVGEGMAAGIINLFGNIFGFIIIEVLNPALERDDKIDL